MSLFDEYRSSKLYALITRVAIWSYDLVVRIVDRLAGKR
jgi:hypothetical protein